MAVRAVNGCTVFRSASLLPLAAFRCRSSCFRTLSFLRNSKLGFPCLILRCDNQLLSYGSMRSYAACSLFDSIMEEYEASRRRRSVRAKVKSKLGFASSGVLEDNKLVNKELQKGFLLEFRKDSGRVLLAVAQRPDGKKNWMVYDQNGATSSIKPQQITYIVPGVENFDQSEISNFLRKAHDNLDPTLLEFAWEELLEKNQSVTTEELAEPLDSYCAHLLLSRDETYFTLEGKGTHIRYGPRSTGQVQELLRIKLAKEAAEKELQEFVQLLISAKEKPADAKPPKSSWMDNEKILDKVQSLESYAIEEWNNTDQRITAEKILKAMGLSKTATAALNILIGIGYYPKHVNLDLIKSNIRTDHSDVIIEAAESLLSESSDMDELDDALSATRLEDGRIQVWIHVADPTRFIQPGSLLDREALGRGTSVFLPTSTYPMFPEMLAMEGMSLKQGEICHAVTVSVVLHSDGRLWTWNTSFEY